MEPPPPKPIFNRTQANWNRISRTETYEAEKAEIEEFNNNLISSMSPAVLEKQRQVQFNWECFIHCQEPDLSDDRIWHSDVVRRNVMQFLPRILQVSTGRTESGKIRGVTLLSYFAQLSLAITRLVRDPDTGLKVGNSLLYGEYFMRLQDQVHTLIIKHGLDRFPQKKIYFDVEELQMMIEQALEDTKVNGRASAIQRITIAVIAFMTGLRPSSLAPCNKVYEGQGKYPRLEDLAIMQLAQMSFQVAFTAKFFKGHINTATGQIRIMMFDPVSNWYNVPFDAAMWIVIYLFMRGALEGIETLEDLANNKLGVISIKPHMLKEPLFLALSAKGEGFAKPMKTITANGVAAAVSTTAESAGLFAGTTYCFRRGTGNFFGVVLGKEQAELMLTHQSDGQLHHYSRNTANIDIVATRLNELPVPQGPNTQHLLERHKRTSRAVQAMRILLDRGARDEASGKSKRIVLSHAEKQDLVDNDAEIEKLENVVEEAFEAFDNCWSYTSKKPYARNRQGAVSLLKNETRKLLVSQSVADAAQIALYAATEALKKYNQSSRRTHRRTKAKTGNLERKTQLDGTTEELDTARDHFKKPSKILLTLAPFEGSTSNVDQETEENTHGRTNGNLKRKTQHDGERETTREQYKKPSKTLLSLAPIEDSTSEVDQETESALQALCNFNRTKNTVNDILFKEDTPDELTDPQTDLPDEPLKGKPPPASASDMRLALMTMVLEPLNAAAELKKNLEANNGAWICVHCQSQYHHDPELQTHDYTSKSQLNRHVIVQHTEWKDLVLKMIIVQDGQVTGYKCPAPTCTFRSKKERKMRDHCTSDCVNADEYQAMEIAHAGIREKKVAVKNPRPRRSRD